MKNKKYKNEIKLHLAKNALKNVVKSRRLSGTRMQYVVALIT